MGRLVWAALLAAGTLAIGGQACAADIFTLQNTNNGDGGVTLLSNGFDLFGANNGTSKKFTSIPRSSLTSYTATAGAAETLSFDWTYWSSDFGGTLYDPGGYLVNGVQFQLSTTGPAPGDASGNVVFNLAAGDSYGFYIFSTDSEAGRAYLEVTPAEGVTGFAALAAAVPEPTTWTMMIGGFFGLGAALRRRRAAAALA
ncbi:MAG: sorting protein [Phenylobacterium sp.]|uniref:PEPxxWA-CTERM sorting domain-containing protein n=1 Tax=Phenylobacterium sp. TaxID=1871053 RepID=UPI0026370124|nr:PEPxxWA-CTERM sorting domain-containing protein [Phenylobacterium sp.]MDB5497829.1 sorting protein [Phenylobacterium sp.]